MFLAVADYGGAIQGSLGGATLGTPEFDHRVGTWIKAWVAHLRSKGIQPDQLGLLIHDEPHEGSDIGPLVAWARAIRAAEPEVLIWEDPTYRDPAKAPAELFEACNVLCPNRPMWLEGGEAVRPVLPPTASGRARRCSSTPAPARPGCSIPYAYYRLQAWQCWQEGATGSFFWAFSDNGGASSWNEYFATAGPFTPLFLDDTTGHRRQAHGGDSRERRGLRVLRDAPRRGRSRKGRRPHGRRRQHGGRRCWPTGLAPCCPPRA